ncbi:hypothetical protein V6U90_30700 [Micromonospora sp. CPCC 206060]|uniref:hypothetical protein n=1 Tax=Micromonospora sp. CPCC 206060 TaxID=3122406 RepID=UPI002FF4282E
MDLNTVHAVVAAAAAGPWQPGDAWLAGGTYLFSEPQQHLRRLLDLTDEGWPPLTLHEEVRVDPGGVVRTAAFRQYHLPTFADIPRTEVHFAQTNDAVGPLGAKSMSESPFNPVAPALANALRDATGIRCTDLPLTADRVWQALNAQGVGQDPAHA